MHLFYLPHAVAGPLFLNEEESKHCIRVLRLKLGDHVLITNGKGWLYDCTIAVPHEKHCELKIESSLEVKKERGNIHIGIAPTKNIDRFEWFLEKATEIGIDEITPLICQRSERQQVKLERLNKVLISAMKQSLSVHLPILNPATDLKRLIQSTIDGQKFMGYVDEKVTHQLKDFYRKGEKVMILIGPEGDFTAEEVEFAKGSGFIPVTLGPSRLRTETAGVVACTIINILNQ